MQDENFAYVWQSSFAWAVLAAAIFVEARYRSIKPGKAPGMCD